MIAAIIGAVGVVVGAVVAAVVTGRRSSSVERQKFRRERASMYSDLTEKGQALSRELWVISFSVGNAATNSSAMDALAVGQSIAGERRANDWRTTGYRQARDEFLETAGSITIYGSRRARSSVGFMREVTLEIDKRLWASNEKFGELSVGLNRYIDLFDKETQRAVSTFRRDLGTTD